MSLCKLFEGLTIPLQQNAMHAFCTPYVADYTTLQLKVNICHYSWQISVETQMLSVLPISSNEDFEKCP